jgi:hypothetical protein
MNMEISLIRIEIELADLGPLGYFFQQLFNDTAGATTLLRPVVVSLARQKTEDACPP